MTSALTDSTLTLPAGEAPDYEALLAEGRALFPGVRIGRPANSAVYWPVIAVLRVLHLRYATRMSGGDHVGSGPAILVGNHVGAMDPVMAVIARWWRVSAFTKIEAFQRRGAFFFRFMGQIPLRRGDARATEWAMQMAAKALDSGWKLGLYPEGTRSPDPAHLHKLHKRILIPVLQANRDVPVHVVTTRYGGRDRFGRRQVEIGVSAPLQIDAGSMDPEDVVAAIRAEMLRMGGQTYVDRYAQEVKAQLRAQEADQA